MTNELKKELTLEYNLSTKMNMEEFLKYLDARLIPYFKKTYSTKDLEGEEAKILPREWLRDIYDCFIDAKINSWHSFIFAIL